MLKRGSSYPEVFIAMIESTIARQPVWRNRSDLTLAAREGTDAIYLGAGYWRALPVWNETTGELDGVRLVNPSCTPKQERMVEQGIAVLCHLEYVGIVQAI